MTTKESKEPEDVPVKDTKDVKEPKDVKATPVGGYGTVTREGATLTDEEWRAKQGRANAGMEPKGKR